MVANGIITKINEGEPTRWVNSLVYKRKQNRRLYLDPKDLNTAILREHHAIPTLEEILPKLHKAKFFSIFDAKCDYWNVVLDEEASYLATFNSPFGSYRFKRMPFGLNLSQEIFQQRSTKHSKDVEALTADGPTDQEQRTTDILGSGHLYGTIHPESHHTASLRQLLKKESKFAWDASQQDVFDRIKNLNSEEVRLTYFDPKKGTVMPFDASTKGLGATLL
ncbi:Hypothetical predicted protein [Paramuricea clavata]|uniref:Reverse transcriptase domain-containing protein n=1 Tax=Paramuricea clavata TaxID=317549 RepID=A0A6S7JDY5_PARCT|nr:Hypothetical predicted protein [Paramuricea clavata]